MESGGTSNNQNSNQTATTNSIKSKGGSSSSSSSSSESGQMKSSVSANTPKASQQQKPRRRRIRSELDRLLSDEGTRNMLRGLKKPKKQAIVTGGVFRKRVLVGGNERGKVEPGKRGGRGFRTGCLRGRAVVRRGRGAGRPPVVVPPRASSTAGSTRGRSRSGSPGKGKCDVKQGGDEDKIDFRFVNVSKRSRVAWVTVVGNCVGGEVKEEKEEHGEGDKGLKKLDGGFGVKVLQSIECAFRVLEQDNSISVIVLQNSHSRYFCNGIELSELVIPSSTNEGSGNGVTNGLLKNSSNSQCSAMIRAMKSLITTLNASRKLLIASITGDCIGFGVMILPLFDFVYANDKSMFKVHYNALGQSPEGVGLFLGLLRGGGAGKLTNLVYLNTPLTATEAQSAGLVTEILWPARYQEELATRIHSMSTNSSLMLKSKLILRNLKRPIRVTDLWGEFGIIEGQWTSSDFQGKAKAFLSCGGVIEGNGSVGKGLLNGG